MKPKWSCCVDPDARALVWECDSPYVALPGESSFYWNIRVLDSGLFSIDNSTAELICGMSAKRMRFFTLEDAKGFCERKNLRILKGGK